MIEFGFVLCWPAMLREREASAESRSRNFHVPPPTPLSPHPHPHPYIFQYVIEFGPVLCGEGKATILTGGSGCADTGEMASK